MPTITQIEPQKHDPERVNVYVDGVFRCGISQYLLLAHGLHQGTELAEDTLDQIQREDSVDRAHAAALNFLSFRPRSRRELLDYFRRKSVEPAVAEAVVERLERASLVDDREFARYWVENRQTFRPRGARALRAEMRAKGVGAEVIDEVLAGLGDEEEEAAALEVARRKLRSLAGLEPREFLQKMVGHLQRRGFGYAVSARVARRLAEGDGVDVEFAESDVSDVPDVSEVSDSTDGSVG